MASCANPTTESPRREEAQQGHEEHVQAGVAAQGLAPEVQQARRADAGCLDFGGGRTGGPLSCRLSRSAHLLPAPC